MNHSSSPFRFTFSFGAVPFLGLISLFLMVACQNNETDQVNPNLADVEATQEMKVPQNFTFQTDRQVAVHLQLENPPHPGKYRFEIYDYRPQASQGVLLQGFAAKGEALQGQLQVPALRESVFVKLISPQGHSQLMELNLSGNTLEHTFFQGKRSTKGKTTSSPDCSQGCDQSQTHSGWWTANNNNEVYCVTGSYNGGGFTIKKNATVRLCGTGNINSLTIDKGGLEITAGADVTVQNLNLNSGGNNLLKIYPGGKLTVTGWFSPDAKILNQGTLEVSALNLNSNADLENEGTFTLTGNSWTTFDGDVENKGSMEIRSHLNINSNCEIENQCQFTVDLSATLNGKIKNKAYLAFNDKLTVNSNGRLELENGAMVNLKDLWLDGKIKGKNGRSLVKVSGNSGANNNARIRDAVDYCDANGIENFPNNIFRQGAQQSCSLFIPTSACNPSGNGTPTVVDSDNDGVADKVDEFPSDPSKAASSYYPSAGQYGTLAFEDLWPNYGDYDFNDLVVDYQYQQYLNASNKVVELDANFVTRARGGSHETGLGFQLDLTPGDIQSVTGTRYFTNQISTNANGTEAGQSKATIIVYDASSEILDNPGYSFVNTRSSDPYVAPDTTRISVTLGSPVSEANLGSGPFNPFIFVDETRGREVHLAGTSPTDLADQNLFGNGVDNTSLTGSTYQSTSNLPWAINVVGGFRYPEEKTDVVQVYNLFDNWAQSGGSSASDWYQDNPGYISQNNLFQAP